MRDNALIQEKVETLMEWLLYFMIHTVIKTRDNYQPKQGQRVWKEVNVKKQKRKE